MRVQRGLSQAQFDFNLQASLLTAEREKKAAMRFFVMAIKANGAPEKGTMDQSGANESAIDQIIVDKEIDVEIRQVKCLNNTHYDGRC